MACFSAMTIIIRLLSGSMHSTEMVLVRNIISLGIVVAWQAALVRGMPRFPTRRISGHFWRATVGIMAMETWFYCLTIMPLTLATALSFTTPIFSTIIAILFLKERAGLRRWLAIGAGFAGIMVILRPDVYGIDHKAVLVLVSSAIMAVSGTLVKTLTRTESPETIVFYMALFMVPWSLLPALPHLDPITMDQFGWLCLIALFSTVAHLMLTRALMRVEMVVLMPFDFTRLVFTAFFAYFLFDEVMDTHTILGSLIIVGSAVYIAHREGRNRQKSTEVTAAP